MTQPRLDKGQAKNLAMASLPQEAFRRQEGGKGVAIDTPRLRQGSVEQIRPQDVESARHGLAIEGADVAL